MGCEEVRPDLVAMLDGELDAASLERARAHLRDCAACARDLAGFEKAQRAVARLAAAAAPSPGSFESLWRRAAEEDAVAAAATSPRRASAARGGGRHGEGRSRWRRWTVPAGALAAGMVGWIALSLYSGPTPRLETDAPRPESESATRVAKAPAAAAVPAPRAAAPEVASRAPEPPRADARPAARAEPRAEAALAARAPEDRVADASRAGTRVATRAKAESGLSNAAVPRELRERPDFFMDLAIVMRLDQLRELDEAPPARAPEKQDVSGTGRS